METINTNQHVYLQVCDRVKQYPYGVGRSDIAADFGISKSTAENHLEKCVDRGLLKKFYGWLSARYRGWVYIDPDSAPKPMFGNPDQPCDLDNDDRYRQLDNLQNFSDALEDWEAGRDTDGAQTVTKAIQSSGEEQHAEDMRAFYAEQNGDAPPYAPDQDRRFPDDPAVYHYDGY